MTSATCGNWIRVAFSIVFSSKRDALQWSETRSGYENTLFKST